MQCTSCGWPTTELVAVRRVYLSPDADGDGMHTVLDEVEHWCVSCASHYPHQPVD